MKHIIYTLIASLLVYSVCSLQCSEYKFCSDCKANASCNYCNSSGFISCQAKAQCAAGTEIATCTPVCVAISSLVNVTDPLGTFINGAKTFNPNTTELTAQIFGTSCKNFLNHDGPIWGSYLNTSGVNCSETSSCSAPPTACTDLLKKFSAAISCFNCDDQINSTNYLNYTKVCASDCDALLTACPIPSNASCDVVSYLRPGNQSSYSTLCGNTTQCRNVSDVSSVVSPSNPCSNGTNSTGTGTGTGTDTGTGTGTGTDTGSNSTSTGGTTSSTGSNTSSTGVTTTTTTTTTTTSTPSSTGNGFAVVVSISLLVVAFLI
jgi:hypothetical protein